MTLDYVFFVFNNKRINEIKLINNKYKLGRKKEKWKYMIEKKEEVKKERKK